MATLSPVQMICHLFLENHGQAGTHTKSVTLQWVTLPLSYWERLQTYQDTVGSIKSWQGNVLHCSQSCVLKHTCCHMQRNVAHQNTLGRGSQTETGLPAGWHRSHQAATACSHRNHLCYSSPQTQSSTFQCVKSGARTAPRWVVAHRSGAASLALD